jgi:hypothetical protein
VSGNEGTTSSLPFLLRRREGAGGEMASGASVPQSTSDRRPRDSGEFGRIGPGANGLAGVPDRERKGGLRTGSFAKRA